MPAHTDNTALSLAGRMFGEGTMVTPRALGAPGLMGNSDQGCCGPGPAFPLALRDRFELFHVRRGLCEHVVEIVANADEREAFVEKLTDSRRPEQEYAENNVVLASS